MPHGDRTRISLQLQPPTTFNFKNLNEWPKWRRRFEQYHLALGLASSEDEAWQVSTLLGEEAGRGHLQIFPPRADQSTVQLWENLMKFEYRNFKDKMLQD